MKTLHDRRYELLRHYGLTNSAETEFGDFVSASPEEAACAFKGYFYKVQDRQFRKEREDERRRVEDVLAKKNAEVWKRKCEEYRQRELERIKKEKEERERGERISLRQLGYRDGVR